MFDLQKVARNLFSTPTYRERLKELNPFGRDANGSHRLSDRSGDKAAARALGWASIGIGLTEIAAPKHVEALLGIDVSAENRGILRVLGVRELMHGVGILADGDMRKLAAGVWSRVAGDGLDSALLSAAAAKTKRPSSFAVVAAMVLAIGVADVLCAVRLSRRER
jgi:hypothetical protein